MRTTHRPKAVRPLTFLAFLAASAFSAAAPAFAAADPSIFAAAPLEITPVIREGIPAAGGPMRLLTVNEHVGLPRKGELVRAPLFFHPGECKDANGLAIYSSDDAAKANPIAYQADDIRKAADGQIAAMHVYFYTDLNAWQRKQFNVYPGTNPAAQTAALPMTENGDQVQFAGDDIKVAFLTKGPRTGAISGLEANFGKINLLDGWMGPDYRLARQDIKCVALRTTTASYKTPETMEIREFKYATGPIFAKVRVTVGPKGVPDSAEATYLIPRHGSMIIATERSFADENDTTDVVGSTWPVVLYGKATFGKDQSPAVIKKIPTGLRKLLRYVQNENVEAAVSEKAGFSIVNIPHVASGGGGMYYQAEDPTEEKMAPKQTLQFMGPGSLHRAGASNSGTIRSFWFQNRIVFVPSTDSEKLWDTVRANQITLNAVVDEPGITVDDLAAIFKEENKKFYEIKYWGKGWDQSAAMDYLAGNEDAVKKALGRIAAPPKKGDDSTLEAWLPKWAQEQKDKLPPLEGRPKGGDTVAEQVQPYNLGYGASSRVPFATYWGPNERLDKMCYSIGRASMLANGAVYKDSGMPHIISFSNAYNMQIGSVYFGLFGGKKFNDPWMTMFYRDVTRSNGAAAIYGHGERCYSSDVRNAEASDLLYQAISDLWLRSIELTQNEDLWIHPSAYARFTDAIDVTGDLQHHHPDPAKHSSYLRGNFFRTQSHDHRWEGWDAAPFMAMLENPNDELPPGITEAYYFTRNLTLAGGINWSCLNNFFHPMVDLKLARDHYTPPVAPALPQGTKVAADPAGGVTITWQANAGDVAGYRVYRSELQGRMMTLLNSPYVPERHKLITETRYNDPAGAVDKFYLVTAVDSKGIESRWFVDEPFPVAGKNAGKPVAPK